MNMTNHINFADPLAQHHPEARELSEKYRGIIAQMFRSDHDRNADPKEIPWHDVRFRNMFYDRSARLRGQADMWCKAHAVIQALMSK